jgi:hypothetical protein
VVAEQASIALQGLADAQVSRIVLAYEPVWAIGTGKTASPDEAATVHRFLRRLIAHDHGDASLAVPILYGGSVSPETVEGLLAQPDISGALVGGASLNVSTLLAILERAARAGVHRADPPLSMEAPRSKLRESRCEMSNTTIRFGLTPSKGRGTRPMHIHTSPSRSIV